MQADQPVRAVLLTLYSQRYPAIGESHGLSVVAGSLRAALPASVLRLGVLDMVQRGQEGCEQAVGLIRKLRANVLAVGLPYGTFSVFQRYYAELRDALSGDHPLVALGGPIATYLSDQILREVAPEAIVILGEAEEALPALVGNWFAGRSPGDVPSLHYRDEVTGEDVRTPRRLADLRLAPAPYRDHIRFIRESGGQIFAETSRGCSWAACTFCLRGLTDIAGRGYEYRRKDAQVVAADLRTLYDLGVRDVTFADEDFLGSSLEEAGAFVGALENSITKAPRFDASITIHSVYSRRDSPEERATRESLLGRLARMGLQKVFLGIESCSPSQLKRYAKGHTREEAAAATRTLQRLGIRVEIGVILFDPLCTLDEIEDSLSFMRAHDLARLASGLSSELRLQVASSYLMMIEKFEQQHDVRLHRTDLDRDTLSYPYVFADQAVQGLFALVGGWNRRLHALYYPAKSLSRFGATGALGEAVYPLREATGQFRIDSCDAILRAIASIRVGSDGALVLDEAFEAASVALAAAVLSSAQALDPPAARHPVVRRAAAAAEAVMGGRPAMDAAAG